MVLHFILSPPVGISQKAEDVGHLDKYSRRSEWFVLICQILSFLGCVHGSYSQKQQRTEEHLGVELGKMPSSAVGAIDVLKTSQPMTQLNVWARRMIHPDVARIVEEVLVQLLGLIEVTSIDWDAIDYMLMSQERDVGSG